MKVVIIDDEKAMHLIMKRMLGKIGEVEIVGSFQETASAYSYLENHEADLIFIDINMPKESGLEFAQRLRADGRQTKLVFVTSHAEYALSAFDVYAYDYMVKPVVQDRLRQTLLRALAEQAALRLPKNREPAADSVRFNCLGGLEIRTAQQGIVKWKSSKSAELFGYLLMHKGRLVARARLIDDIFGGMPQKNAEIYLNTTVYQLRKLLETHGLRTCLYSDGNRYALDLGRVQVDMIRFEEGCRQMTVIDDVNIGQALELEQLFTGDLFGDRAYPWAWNEVERLSQVYALFARRLSIALLNRGDIPAAIRLLMKLAARNELDEDTMKLLMNAYAQQKNQEALTRLYRQFKNTLHKELDVSPSLEMEALYKRLLAELRG